MTSGSTKDNPYLAGLKLLARRELSEAQLRARLTRAGHDPSGIDAAIRRLTADGSLNDVRVAEAIARTQVGLKQRGRYRVVQALERAGIAPATAKRAFDQTMEAVDPDGLIDAVLEKRLRGRPIADQDDARRLYRYLVARGFESERVMSALERRRPRHRD
jgi:regulatory protein